MSMRQNGHSSHLLPVRHFVRIMAPHKRGLSDEGWGGITFIRDVADHKGWERLRWNSISLWRMKQVYNCRRFRGKKKGNASLGLGESVIQ